MRDVDRHQEYLRRRMLEDYGTIEKVEGARVERLYRVLARMARRDARTQLALAFPRKDEKPDPL